MRRLKPVLAGGLLTVTSLLLGAGLCFGQYDDRGTAAGLAILGGFLFFFLILFGVIYIYMALAVQTIAKKTNTENAWWAWIPILNVLLMLNIAKKPMWWVILFLIPIVGLVISIIVWMAIAEARGKPNWWGILLIVPLLGLVVPGYLAWSDGSSPAPAAAPGA
jgi:uncharacterized protein DUF5684